MCTQIGRSFSKKAQQEEESRGEMEQHHTHKAKPKTKSQIISAKAIDDIAPMRTVRNLDSFDRIFDLIQTPFR